MVLLIYILPCPPFILLLKQMSMWCLDVCVCGGGMCQSQFICSWQHIFSHRQLSPHQLRSWVYSAFSVEVAFRICCHEIKPEGKKLPKKMSGQIFGSNISEHWQCLICSFKSQASFFCQYDEWRWEPVKITVLSNSLLEIVFLSLHACCQACLALESLACGRQFKVQKFISRRTRTADLSFSPVRAFIWWMGGWVCKLSVSWEPALIDQPRQTLPAGKCTTGLCHITL